MVNIVVFASGSGTNFQSIIDAAEDGQIAGQIRGLITNKSGIQAIERANNHNIEHEVLAPSDFTDRQEYTETLLNHLGRWDTDLIALAGYMIKIPAEVISKYEDRIVNIHPALLPKYGGKGFYGMNVHRAVLQNEETESGCTVHLVTEEYDAGPILDQTRVPVKDSDDATTLAKRILKEEHKLFPKTIAKLADQLNKSKNNVSLQPLSELPQNDLTIERALISVSNKTGIVELAEQLNHSGVEIISTGGTAQTIRHAGIPVTDVSEITGFEECLDGRVKTLHPIIHGGILGRTSYQPDLDEMKQLNIKPIELVVGNLYPFKETVAQADCTPAIATENIDIGGPTMIRAAAKNFAHICVLTSPNEYKELSAELEENGSISFEKRRQWAKNAFNHTANYDAAIANYFNELDNGAEELPDQLNISLAKSQTLRYGENPHQKAAVYGEQSKYIDCFHGKQLSYNNFLDVNAALNLIADFQNSKPTCAIFKHTVPCGVASDQQLSTAWDKAFQTDTMSPFGGIVAVNRELDLDTAQKIDEIFTEIIIAPSYSDNALELLKQKKKRRLIRMKEFVSAADTRNFSSIFGGALCQEADSLNTAKADLKTVTKREPTEQEIDDLLFAWKVVKHVKSNAIVYAKNEQTIGIGTGQTSRVEASEVAIAKAQQEGLSLKDTAIASDAFFPFADGVEAAAKAGARSVIQPGGSIRDEEVIKAANDLDLAMVFTDNRHFRH